MASGSAGNEFAQLNPNALMMRMPAFGLSGPWRDNTGFAQTMEQLSGHGLGDGSRDDQPRIPRGPCDPLAGMHASLRASWSHWPSELRRAAGTTSRARWSRARSTSRRSRSSSGAPTGACIERDGNRSPLAAPQGLYRVRGRADGDGEVARALDRDRRAVARAASLLGEPDWAMDSALETSVGRRRAHDAIDAALRAWTRERGRAEIVAELRARGIPASEVANPCRLLQTNPQLRARRYFESAGAPGGGRDAAARRCPSATRASSAGCGRRRRRSVSTTSTCCPESSASRPTSFASSRPTA